MKKEDHERFVRISFLNSVRTFDPTMGVDSPSTYVMKMLFEGLMLTGPDGTLRPALAKSYTISEDHLTYTFTLRSSQWSNGDPVTAYDFEYSWKKVLDPTKETMGAYNLYPIKNARAAALNLKGLDEVGIKALDATTLQVELEHPTPYFLEILTRNSFMPINAKVDQERPDWALQVGEKFVCNGPYRLTTHHFENEIIVQKNPTYWNHEDVKMPGIHIFIIKDSITQLQLYEKNQIDWLGKPFSDIPNEALEHLKQKNEIHFLNSFGVRWYFFNVEAPPFHNAKMRKAFAYAINRQLITDHLLAAKETPATGILPFTLATQSTPFFEDNNPDLAVKLFNEALAEMGITKQQLPEITLHIPTIRTHFHIGEAVQQQWNRTFGLNIKLQQQEWKVHFAKLRSGDYQIGEVGMQSWLRDPFYIMQTFRDKDDGYNMSRWENEKYQSLLTATEFEIDLDKRKEYFNQAEALLMDEMPVIPLYFTTIFFAKNKKLKNVYISELYEIDFRWSYFEEN